ncbi:MAG TPA: hypothetical protein ENJ84_04770 [Gammaproteobacteria bacterium]|nr:hypothetical protein [Gammaproteobacteria bacterium]
MSDQFELSEQLFTDVKSAIQGHDGRASDDLIAVQYMAAMMGYVLASQNMSREKRRDILDQLHAFAGHVLEQVEGNQPQPPAEDAFGIWRPGDA